MPRCPCRGKEDAWRTTCCVCCTARFEQWGLLFKDRQRERLFLQDAKTGRHPSISFAIFVSVFCVLDATFAVAGLMFGLFTLSGFAGLHNLPSFAICVVAPTLAATVSVVLWCCKRRAATPEQQYPWTSSAAMLLAYTVLVWSVGTGYLFHNILPVQTCTYSDDEIDIILLVADSNGTWPADSNTSAAFDGIRQFARHCGWDNGLPIITLITFAWVFQKVVVISDLFAARSLIVLMPLSAAALLVNIAWLGVGFEWATVAQCMPFVKTVGMQAMVELVAGVVAASGALLVAATQSEQSRRKLFSYTSKLRVDASLLRQEANPFGEDNIRKWLNSMVSSAPVRGGAQVANSYWAMPSEDIELLDLVGVGSRGVVWRAKFCGCYVVAAKKVNAKEGALRDVAREVGLLAQLCHDHVVKFFGLCRHAGRAESADGGIPSAACILIVQEYCPSSLRNLLTSRGHCWWSSSHHGGHSDAPWYPEAIRIAAETACGMAYLHSRGIVHRDLNPSNILLTHTGKVRVGDFDISWQQRPFQSVRHVVTPNAAPKGAVGTPGYMAPETCYHLICRDDDGGSAAPAVDSYAFGIVLWELLANPVGDYTDTLRELAQCAPTFLTCTNEDLTWPAFSATWEWPSIEGHVGPECPHDVQNLIASCWQLSAQDRPSMVAVLKDLQSLDTAAARVVDDNGAPLSDLPRHTDDANIDESIGPVDSADHRMRFLSDTTDRSVEALRSHAEPLLADDGAELLLKHGAHPQRQVAFRCWRNMWFRCGLHFDMPDAEAKFLQYHRGATYFRTMRWVFMGLVTMYTVACGLMAAPVGSEFVNTGYVVSNIAAVLLFGFAFVCGSGHCWYSFGRCGPIGIWVLAAMWQLCVVVSVLTVAPPLLPTFQAFAAAQNTTGWAAPAGSAAFNDVFLDSSGVNATLQNVCAGRIPCEEACQYAVYGCACCGDVACDPDAYVITAAETVQFEIYLGQLQYAAAIGLPAFHVCTLPVVLLVLRLPFRQYASVILFPPAAFLAREIWYPLSVVDVAVPTSIVQISAVIAAVIVATFACIKSALVHEQAQRSMFKLYCSLVAEEDHFAEDAKFLRYRDALRNNRQHLHRSRELKSSRSGPRATTALTSSENVVADVR